MAPGDNKRNEAYWIREKRAIIVRMMDSRMVGNLELRTTTRARVNRETHCHYRDYVALTIPESFIIILDLDWCVCSFIVVCSALQYDEKVDLAK